MSYPISLPAGYQTPTGLAENSATGGLWFYSIGLTNQTLFYWSPASAQLKGFNLPNSLPASTLTGLTVGSSGNAWIGLNNVVAEVSPSAGVLKVIPLPRVAVGAAGSGLPVGVPVDPGEHAPVTAMATGNGGSILVSRQFATAIQVINPATFAVSALPLPTGTALGGGGTGVADLVTAEGGGDVAVALYRPNNASEIGQYVNGSWTTTAISCPPAALFVSGGQLTASGSAPNSGCVASGVIPPSGVVTLSTPPVSGIPVASCAFALSTSMVLVCGTAGMNGLSASGSISPVISLGKVLDAATPSAPAKLTPLADPGLWAPAGAGKAWFVVDLRGAPKIGLISHT